MSIDKKTLAVVRFQFAQTVFNHKIQEIAAARKDKYAKGFIWFQLALTITVIIVLAVQAAGAKNTVINVIGIVAGALELIFLIIDLTFGFHRQVADHKAYALKYLDLRSKYMALIADIMSSPTRLPENMARRDALNDAYQMLTDAPRTTEKDFIDTQKALNTAGAGGSGQFTWSDEEIDQFLPAELHLLKHKKEG